MAGNATNKKQYGNDSPEPVKKAQGSKTVSMGNKGTSYTGQLYENTKFAEPMNKGINAKISGISGTYDDIGEKSGFITEGYFDKNGMEFGEGMKLNFLPPGMDISNQENVEIHDMPLRLLTAESYPGDGWMPTPRDVQE